MSSRSKSKPAEKNANSSGSKQTNKSEGDEGMDYDKGKVKFGETVSNIPTLCLMATC